MKDDSRGGQVYRPCVVRLLSASKILKLSVKGKVQLRFRQIKGTIFHRSAPFREGLGFSFLFFSFLHPPGTQSLLSAMLGVRLLVHQNHQPFP
jgi:hypothetical protein